MNDTTGPAPAVTDEIRAHLAETEAAGIDLGAEYLAGMRAALHQVDAALAGRTVVELPEPDGRTWTGWSMWDAEARHVEARVDQQGRPFVRCGDRIWLVSEAEAVGLALVAAAREARRLASESTGDGEFRG